MSFILSKLFWFFAQPGNLFLIAMAIAVALLWSRRRVLARRVLLALVILGLVVSVLPLRQWLVVPLENRFASFREAPSHADGVIVLGGAVDQFVTRARGQIAVRGSVERLLAFARLAKKYPKAKLVFSGGSGNLFRQDIKEAEAARQLLGQLGLDVRRVLFEDRSRNTAEGARLSRALAKPRPGEVWVLITSASHMPRAYGAFRALGWRVTPYPVDYTTEGDLGFRVRFSFAGGLGGLAGGLKEWVGLAYFYLSGRSDRLFPAPERGTGR